MENDSTMAGMNHISDAHTSDMHTSDFNAALDGAAAAELPLSVTIRPLDQALDQWNELIQASGNATLFHTPAWAQVLRRAYGFRVLAATIERRGKVLAGCLLARTRNPFERRFVGLPFSDSCPPLGIDEDATAALMRGLAAEPRLGGNLEIRGIRAPAPWQTIDYFEQWSIDLARPFAEIQRAADRNFRRQVKHAAAAAFKIETGDSAAMLSRFYAIQLETRRRLGVPPQPLRFFSRVRETFAQEAHGLEVWLASSAGRDQAVVVLLRDGPRLYAKWSARTAENAAGASHLLFSAILEHHAGKAASLDLGRTDSRNRGLTRFKAEMGATPAPLPYSYFPRTPRSASAEDPDRSTGALARIWRRLPLPVTRAVGAIAYGYLA
ncbi:MAG TPA: GNAT family N-acetyltransferase [Candidatus Binataceae bacterium]|nr:GNAT family N-acetyltransferase [Candidatus Binataceae bacterium]